MRAITLPRLLGVLGVIYSCVLSLASGAQQALIVIGTPGDSSTAGELAGTAKAMGEGLAQRGFTTEILGLPGQPKIRREDVLARLQAKHGLSTGDEFWLVLLGFSARNSEGAVAFQVAGPRLSADDLKGALDTIPARQCVFIGTSDSGRFIPPLLRKDRPVLAATKEEGEIDLPRFPKFWAEALKENPQASWRDLAARAVVLTDQDYAENNLAVGEHARFGDPATGQILEAPFGADLVAKPEEKSADDGSMALINASDIKVDIHEPNSEWEKQPATAATRQLVAEARAVPNPSGYDSIMLEQRLGYTLGEDRTAEDFTMQRIYIEREDGVARWANFLLPQDPPAISTKVEAARIIQPDGSSTVFNPAKMPPATDISSDTSNALTTVFMPDAHAGCLIEIAYRTRHLLDASMPEFSEELPVQLDIPVLQSELQLQVPEKSAMHYKLSNLDTKPVETTANGVRTLVWKLGTMAAFEPLPYDPPMRESVVALNVTSLDSWDQFATWYRRLARGSEVRDDTVKQKAAELAAGTHTRLEKIRKAYEFVSALRYVAIEFGINGLRPRTPAVVLRNRYGDCKDKANLLIALLGEMGIDARFCLLNRGSSTDITFPSWQFNHAIAYVPKTLTPDQPDDLWLDTTDSTAPFPTLSPGDTGASALVFAQDSTQFLTVRMEGKDETVINEKWRLRQASDQRWSGTLDDDWSGLAEYDVRAKFRGRSPLQRDFLLQEQLLRQLNTADFTDFQLSPADDLATPLHLSARLENPEVPHPRPAFEPTTYFGPTARNRPLFLNDGQRLQDNQTVEWSFAGPAPAPLPAPFHGEKAGVEVSAEWQRVDDRTWRLTSQLEVKQPTIAVADYAGVRALLRDWIHHLTP
jgi:hypothetical protein